MLRSTQIPLNKHGYADYRPNRTFLKKRTSDGLAWRATHMNDATERLFYAIEQGYLGTVTTMVNDNHIPIDVVHCYTDLTPLMVAAQHGKVNVARFLLESGAAPNAVSPSRRCTALSIAVEGDTPGHLHVAELLLKYGALASFSRFSCVESPILLACTLNRHELLQPLLDVHPFAFQVADDDNARRAKQADANECFRVLLTNRNVDGVYRFVKSGVAASDPSLLRLALRLGDMDAVTFLRSNWGQPGKVPDLGIYDGLRGEAECKAISPEDEPSDGVQDQGHPQEEGQEQRRDQRGEQLEGRELIRFQAALKTCGGNEEKARIIAAAMRLDAIPYPKKRSVPRVIRPPSDLDCARLCLDGPLRQVADAIIKDPPVSLHRPRISKKTSTSSLPSLSSSTISSQSSSSSSSSLSTTTTTTTLSLPPISSPTRATAYSSPTSSTPFHTNTQSTASVTIQQVLAPLPSSTATTTTTNTNSTTATTTTNTLPTPCTTSTSPLSSYPDVNNNNNTAPSTTGDSKGDHSCVAPSPPNTTDIRPKHLTQSLPFQSSLNIDTSSSTFSTCNASLTDLMLHTSTPTIDQTLTPAAATCLVLIQRPTTFSSPLAYFESIHRHFPEVPPFLVTLRQTVSSLERNCQDAVSTSRPSTKGMRRKEAVRCVDRLLSVVDDDHVMQEVCVHAMALSALYCPLSNGGRCSFECNGDDTKMMSLSNSSTPTVTSSQTKSAQSNEESSNQVRQGDVTRDGDDYGGMSRDSSSMTPMGGGSGGGAGRCRLCGASFIDRLREMRALRSLLRRRQDLLLREKERLINLRDKTERQVRRLQERDARIGRIATNNNTVAGRGIPTSPQQDLGPRCITKSRQYRLPPPSPGEDISFSSILRTVQGGRPTAPPLRTHLPHPSLVVPADVAARAIVATQLHQRPQPHAHTNGKKEGDRHEIDTSTQDKDNSGNTSSTPSSDVEGKPTLDNIITTSLNQLIRNHAKRIAKENGLTKRGDGSTIDRMAYRSGGGSDALGERIESISADGIDSDLTRMVYDLAFAYLGSD